MLHIGSVCESVCVCVCVCVCMCVCVNFTNWTVPVHIIFVALMLDK